MYSYRSYLCWVFAFFACISGLQAQEVRTIDGTENNLANPTWGAFQSQILRDTENSYLDGSSIPDELGKPNSRNVSNIIFNQQGLINDSKSHSSYVWAFGQFLDHDISLVESNHLEHYPIELPADEDIFTAPISMFRSAAIEGTGIGPDNPRQYTNEVTAYLDASVVYGSTSERAAWLRTFEGGKLRTSEGDLLPWNTVTGEYNDAFDPTAPFMADDTRSGDKMFVAGDVRANENPLLLTIHTIFVREHNRLCEDFAKDNNWDDERLYQEARRMIGAYIQSITYEEWLPSVNIDIPAYTSYKVGVNPGINNVFSAAAFRMGHTLINGEIVRMKNNGETIELGNQSLRDGFFKPKELVFAGVESYAKGMATQVQQEMDAKVVDEVRNFLFEDGPNGPGLDLAAINISRGRERGLADYNTLRDEYTLAKINSFNQLTDDENLATKLESLYGDVDNLDAWVGMLAEKHIEGSMFGDLVNKVLIKQFQNLRDGDRFYYENDPALSDSRKKMIKETTLHDIIMRNCDIEVMQKNVFSAMPHNDIPDGPELVETHLEAAIFPNPVSDGTQLKIFSQIEEEVTVRIFDIQGRMLFTVTDELLEGDNFLNLSMQTNDWRKGFYSLVITTDDNIKTLKFTIQ